MSRPISGLVSRLSPTALNRRGISSCARESSIVVENIFFLLIFEVISKALAVRMILMDVPSPAVLGESVELTCSFDMENDTLYSIKWYKNDIEFYRYVPNDWPPGQYMPIPGVNIDLKKSGKTSVYLQHVDINSSGIYRCEVSAEAPSFRTVNAKKKMEVYVVPSEGPKITGGRPRYHIGDQVVVNCSSVKSKPAATLKWFINDVEAGPEYEKEYSTTLYADGLESSTVTLRFMATDRQFRDGNMRLKCTANISRLYTMSNEELVFDGRQQNSNFHVESVPKEVRDSSSSSSRLVPRPIIPFLLLVLVMVLSVTSLCDDRVFVLRNVLERRTCSMRKAREK